MSQKGRKRHPFKWRLLDYFRYAPGTDRGRGAPQYVPNGQFRTHAAKQKRFIRSPRQHTWSINAEL
jgi:hypothetical protein